MKAIIRQLLLPATNNNKESVEKIRVMNPWWKGCVTATMPDKGRILMKMQIY